MQLSPGGSASSLVPPLGCSTYTLTSVKSGQLGRQPLGMTRAMKSAGRMAHKISMT
jgi:hypothetical protein